MTLRSRLKFMYWLLFFRKSEENFTYTTVASIMVGGTLPVDRNPHPALVHRHHAGMTYTWQDIPANHSICWHQTWLPTHSRYKHAQHDNHCSRGIPARGTPPFHRKQTSSRQPTHHHWILAPVMILLPLANTDTRLDEPPCHSIPAPDMTPHPATVCKHQACHRT